MRDVQGNKDDKLHHPMSTVAKRYERETNAFLSMRQLADQAFSRAAGAPLVPGNNVRLLIDAKENYPAWLDAIKGARHYIHFESYIIHEDDTGWTFADALVAKAKADINSDSNEVFDRMRANTPEG